MSNSRKLTALFAATVAVTLMSGTSAFAETRHRDVTSTTERNFNDRSANRQTETRPADNNNSRYDNRSERQSNNSAFRGNDRTYNTDRTRSYDNSNRTYNADRNRSYDNNNRSYSYNNSRTYRNDTRVVTRSNESFRGRVERFERYNGGFRVWVGGARFPFFISADRWARFPLRVGVNIALGGYWNPLGYYDVYDVGPYATAGDLHGVVENIDYRRGTLVMRDDVSGSFVTVVMRGNDPRFGSLREGDQIDLSGAWNRSGVFDAYNVAGIRGGAYDPRYDDGRGY